MESKQGSNIKVFCRFRPFNNHEIENKAEKIHRIAASKQLIVKDPNRSQEISFMFDNVFDCQTTQEQIYHNVGNPVLNNILDGFNGTIMAYGQTSSGKTHTMQGHDVNDKQNKGLIPRIIENLFLAIQRSPQNVQFKLKVSIFQLYMQKIRDLLDVSKVDLKIRQNKNAGPYVENLTQAYISDKIQLYKLIYLGQKNRATCMTNMNSLSSRSHMIFLLSLSQMNLQTSQAKVSKLFLIDLAGSEKVSKTGAEGMVLQQAKKINLSLTSLGMVIKGLSEGQSHVPYRDSKLTRIIKDSLGGNAKTTLIVTCSPHQMHVSETISTLRFGENAQKIKNKPKINKELTVPQLQKIIEQLQLKIDEKNEWIKALQEYIKKDLNASLPKYEKKIKISKANDIQQQQAPEDIQQQITKQVTKNMKKDDKNLSSFPTFQGQVEAISTQTSILKLQLQKKQVQIQTIQGELEKHFQIMKNEVQNSYNTEQITILEAELQSYKQNLQSQLNKFYQLKKQYNELTENLKDLIQQNIEYQQKEKQYEIKICEQKQLIGRKYRKNCSLIFGEILDSVSSCRIQDEKNRQNKKTCFEKLNMLIDEKGKALCLEGQNINFVDYWKTQKQAINKKMQDVIQKSMNIQKKLDKKQQNSEQDEEKKSLENKKIIELQAKLDGLFNEYQQMLVIQTNWKVQCQLYERKLKQKQDKIAELRNLLQQMQEQMELIDEENNETMSVNTKIVKPLKGGFLFR